MSEEHNPRAFAASASEYNNKQPGMSLRDWFAGQALSGILANRYVSGIEAAARAYSAADKMLEQRAKRIGQNDEP